MKIFQKFSKKGIVLVTTLFVLTFLFMFAGIIVSTSQNSLRNTTSYQQKEQAMYAALSGVSYARWRIKTTNDIDVLWQGCQQATGSVGSAGSSSATYEDSYIPSGIDTSKLKVVEHHISSGKGWVEGTVKGETPAKFFIYFAPPPSVEFNDPLVGKVKARYLSLNNTDSDEENVNYTVAGDEYRHVPPHAANIIVQGRCGKAEEHIEIMLLKLPNENFDSVGISNNDMAISMNSPEAKWLITSEMMIPPKVRSGGNIYVTSNDIHANKDYVQVDLSGYGKANGEVVFSPDYPDDDFSPESVGFSQNAGDDQSRHIPLLSWDDIKDDSASPLPLPAGTYLFKRNDSGDIVIEYYPTDRDNPTISPTTINWERASSSDQYRRIFQFESNGSGDYVTYKVNIISPIKVEPKSTGTNGEDRVTDIVFKCDSSTEMAINLASTEDKNVFIYNPNGDVTINGMLTGTGAVYAGGNIAFEGKSHLEADSGHVCVYAEGDVKLNRLSKPPESNPLGNPSKYIAKALLKYLNKLKDKQKNGDVQVEMKLGKKEMDDILGSIEDSNTWIPVTVGGVETDLPLRKILSSFPFGGPPPVYYGFGYDDKKMKEIVKDFAIKNADKIGKGGKLIYLTSEYPDRLQDIIDNPNTVETSIKPFDQVLKGLVYAGNNFIADIENDSLTIQGALVSRNGKIEINAGSVTWSYDPRYLGPLYNLGSHSYRTLYWASFSK